MKNPSPSGLLSATHLQNKRSKVRLNPNVSVDCVVLGFDGEQLGVLLIDRGQTITVGKKKQKIYALPGNLIRDDESLDAAATRVLKELTNLDQIFLEQFGAFGRPDRLKKDFDQEWLHAIRAQPDARVITVAYYSLVRSDHYVLHAASFAREAIWHPVKRLPLLGFDHKAIIKEALNQIKFKINYQPIGFELLPRKFTLGQLQKLYEAIIGIDLDKRNFRRKILKMDFLIPLDEKEKGVPHKPARFYRFDKAKYTKYRANDFYFRL